MSIRPIQVEVPMYLGQTDPGSWDVETAYRRPAEAKYAAARWTSLTEGCEDHYTA